MTAGYGFSGTSAYQFCRHFTNVIGERVQGLENTIISKDYIQRQFTDFGLEKVRAEAFPVITSRQKPASIKASGKSFGALSFGLSGTTDTDGVCGSLIYLNPWELRLTADQLTNIAGKIVLLYSRAVSQQTFRTLIDAEARAIVYITYHPKTPPQLPMGFVYASLDPSIPEQIPPIVAVSYHDGQWLRAHAKEVTIQSSVQTFRSESYNITGELPGNKSDEVILLSAHYDTVPYSVGATDNAAGTAILMELARSLASIEHRRTLRFFACGAEEGALLGAQQYCTSHRRTLTDIKLNLNYDVQGTRLGNLALGVLAANKLQKHLHKQLDPWKPEIRFAPTGGDNKVFAGHGIPAVHWWFGGGSNFLFNHTPRDTLSNITASSLDYVGTASEHLLASMNNLRKLEFPIPPEQKTMIEKSLERIPKLNASPKSEH